MFLKALRFFALALFSTNLSSASVLLITHAYNRPDFIEIQHRTFQKFLQDEYEYVVFNDAPIGLMRDAIFNVCSKNQIRCIPIPPEIHALPYLARNPEDNFHGAGVRHVNGIQYSLDTLGFDYDGIVTIIDSDMFLIRPFSITSFMGDHLISAVMRGADNGISYLWPGICMLNMKNLPDKESIDFNCGFVYGANCDSGGFTYYYLEAHPEIPPKAMNEEFGYSLFCPDRFVPQEFVNVSAPLETKLATYQKIGFNDKEIKFLLKQPHTISFNCDQHFLHYRAGSNYDHQSQIYENEKSALIYQFIDDILEEASPFTYNTFPRQ